MEETNDITSSASLIELTDWIWYEVPSDQKQTPTPRQLHTGVVYRDEWYLFGGFTKEAPLDELWSLSLATKVWKQFKKLRSWPRSRHSHTAVSRSITKEDNTSVENMIIFGGVTDNGEVLNDVWEYSFKKSSWNKLVTTGDVPAPRWGHSAVIYRDELWVFGGFSDTINCDLYCLNLKSQKWRRVQAEDGPSERHFHSANVYNDKMYIFGGLAIKNLGDMMCFHFASEKWETVKQTNTITARRGHQSFLFDHYLVVHGGRDNKEASTDLNVFDFENSNWDTIKTDATAPTPRYFHKACFWQNAIVVFGGLGVKKNVPLESNGKVKYSNLNDLFYYSFKGNVFTDINAINGRFSVMPLDILKCCLEYLDAQSLSRLSRVNRFFYFVSSAENLWKRCAIARSNRDTNFGPVYSLDSEYKALKSNNNNNNNNDNITVDDVRLDGLLGMMRSKMKPNIKQFYWKYHFIQRILSARGVSWRPVRASADIERGYDYVQSASYAEFKITVIGDGGVGKSSTCIQFVQNHFVEEYGHQPSLSADILDPTIDDNFRKQVQIPGRDRYFMLELLDVSGPEEYSAMRDQWIRSGNGLIIIYSTTNRQSFEQVTGFIDQIVRVKDQEPNEIAIVIVGNKCDMGSERQVTSEEGLALAKKYDYPFFEASAKSRINIEEQMFQVMEEIACKYFAKRDPKPKRRKDNCLLQ